MPREMRREDHFTRNLYNFAQVAGASSRPTTASVHLGAHAVVRWVPCGARSKRLRAGLTVPSAIRQTAGVVGVGRPPVRRGA